VTGRFGLVGGGGAGPRGLLGGVLVRARGAPGVGPGVGGAAADRKGGWPGGGGVGEGGRAAAASREWEVLVGGPEFRGGGAAAPGLLGRVG